MLTKICMRSKVSEFVLDEIKFEELEKEAAESKSIRSTYYD